MIPKIIHYCWLSKDPMPTEAKECIASWKRHMPNWEIKLWDMNSLDINSVSFVREAVKARKWAFAADYIRVYAIYNYGGIYLDSDVYVRKPLDFVLENQAFSAVEYYPQLAEKLRNDGIIDSYGNKKSPEIKIHGIQIQAAILGGEKGHSFFRECLDYYSKATFKVNEDGIPVETDISPIIFAGIAEKHGFKYYDQTQFLDNGMKLYPSNIFCSQPYLMKKEAAAVHCCNASWRSNKTTIKRITNNMKTVIKTILLKLGLRKEKSLEKLK